VRDRLLRVEEKLRRCFANFDNGVPVEMGLHIRSGELDSFISKDIFHGAIEIWICPNLLSRGQIRREKESVRNQHKRKQRSPNISPGPFPFDVSSEQRRDEKDRNDRHDPEKPPKASVKSRQGKTILWCQKAIIVLYRFLYFYNKQLKLWALYMLK